MSDQQESSESVKKVAPQPRFHLREEESQEPTSSDGRLWRSRPGKAHPDNILFQEAKPTSASERDEATDERQQAPPKEIPQGQSGKSSSAKPQRPPSGRRGRKAGFWRSQITIGWVLVLLILGTVLGGVIFYSLGTKNGIEQAEAAAVKENVELTNDFQATLDSALADLQSGRGVAAVASLSKLQKDAPNISSMAILIANAALLADDIELAQKKITESIERREAISDALTLQAMIEAKMAMDKSYQKMGSPKLRIEHLLRQAIAADSANARPYYELATLKRFENKPEEALALLHSAKRRMNAVDSRFTTDLAVDLVELQMLEDDSLPALSERPRLDAQTLLCSAYIALRQRNSDLAAKFFKQASEVLPENVFHQLIKDPAFLPYAKDPALGAFFAK